MVPLISIWINYGLYRKGLQMPRVELNTPAPEIRLKDYRDQEFVMSTLQGKKRVLLVFNRGFV